MPIIAKFQTHSNKVNQGFSEAALAGLAAKEDFASIKLKNSDAASTFQIEYPPYKDFMLLQIKGNHKENYSFVYLGN